MKWVAVALACLALLVPPPPVEAQPAGKVSRIGGDRGPSSPTTGQ